MILAFDLDGCFANFTKKYAELLTKLQGSNTLPEGWTGDDDPHFPTSWNWEQSAGFDKEIVNRAWKEHIFTDGKFWHSLEALPTAHETIYQLNRLAKEGHDIYFLTHRAGKRAKQQTEQWLYDRGMDYPTVLLSGKKLDVLNGIEADAFIDDKTQTVNETALGRYRMKTFVKDAPYNRKDVNSLAIRVSTVRQMVENLGLWKESKSTSSTTATATRSKRGEATSESSKQPE